MHKTTAFSIMVFLVFLSGCSILASPTPTAVPPTDTPLPTATQSPTSTITSTPLPTNTPTVTNTPGPLKISDDFSSKSNIWGDCPGCRWEDGRLLMGPYKHNDAPEDTYRLVCEACSKQIYYRMAVDVQFVEGFGMDRGFGLLVIDNEDRLYDLEISTAGFSLFWEFDYSTQLWTPLNYRQDQYYTGLVKTVNEINHLEVIAKPREEYGYVDYYVNINNKTAFIVWNKQVKPGYVGLAVGWYGVGVAFDNFEFEEMRFSEEK